MASLKDTTDRCLKSITGEIHHSFLVFGVGKQEQVDKKQEQPSSRALGMWWRRTVARQTDIGLSTVSGLSYRTVFSVFL